MTCGRWKRRFAARHRPLQDSRRNAASGGSRPRTATRGAARAATPIDRPQPANTRRRASRSPRSRAHRAVPARSCRRGTQIRHERAAHQRNALVPLGARRSTRRRLAKPGRQERGQVQRLPRCRGKGRIRRTPRPRAAPPRRRGRCNPGFRAGGRLPSPGSARRRACVRVRHAPRSSMGTDDDQADEDTRPGSAHACVPLAARAVVRRRRGCGRARH